MRNEEKEGLTTYMAGVIGVDAGLCWIGDPSYVLHCDDAKNKKPESIGKNWWEFCGLLGQDYSEVTQFHYDIGHAGLGVCVRTGYGDGVYPVFVTKNKEGRVVRVTVEFVSYEDKEPTDAETETNAYELCPNCQCSVLPECTNDGKCPDCLTETENGGE